MEKLIIEGAGNWVYDHVIESHRTVLGRDPKCDIVLRDPRVSSRHAAVLREGGGILVEDMQSSNGTYVNGERVTRRLLSDEDTIRIGNQNIKVKVLATSSRLNLDHLSRSLPPRGGSSRRETMLGVKARLAELPLPQENLHCVLEMLVTTMGADNGYIMLVDPDTTRYTVKAWKGINPALVGPDDLGISHSVADMAVREGRSVLSSDTKVDMRFSTATSVVDLGIQSVLCTPLLRSEVVCGVVYLDCRSSTVQFSEDDRLIVEEYSQGIAEVLAEANQPRAKEAAAEAYQAAVEAEAEEDARELEYRTMSSLLVRLTQRVHQAEFMKCLLEDLLDQTQAPVALTAVLAGPKWRTYTLARMAMADSYHREILEKIAVDMQSRLGVQVKAEAFVETLFPPREIKGSSAPVPLFIQSATVFGKNKTPGLIYLLDVCERSASDTCDAVNRAYAAICERVF